MNKYDTYQNTNRRLNTFLATQEDTEDTFDITDPYVNLICESGNIKLAKSLYVYKRDGHTAIIAAQRLIRDENFSAAADRLEDAKRNLVALRKEIGEYKTSSIFGNLVGMLIGALILYVDDGLGGIVQSVVTTIGDTIMFGPIAGATGINPRTLSQTVRDIDANYQELKSTAKISKSNLDKKRKEEKDPAKKRNLKDTIQSIDLSGFNTLYMRACNAANDIEICIEKLQRQLRKAKPNIVRKAFHKLDDGLSKALKARKK